MNKLSSYTHQALAFEGICHSYDDYQALKSLSLDIQQGEMICLLGPSGCGKTTALRIAAGLEVPEEGRLIVNDQIVVGDGKFIPPEKRDIGLVFQDYALFPHLTVEGNIRFGMKGRNEDRAATIVPQVLEDVGMLDYREAYPHMLSGGQQQRIALARALAREPKLILMDEPFSGLDARLRDNIRDRTLHLVKKSGVATLMVTHDSEEAMYMADRIVVMNKGSIVQVGTPEELYFQPVNEFVAAFFGEVNSMTVKVEDGKIQSALGVVDAQGFGDGQDVRLVVRPEAVKLESVESQVTEPGYARVLASRLLGRTSLVHMCVCDTYGEEIHLHGRIPGRYLPEEGSYQRISLDMQQVFVFA